MTWQPYTAIWVCCPGPTGCFRSGVQLQKKALFDDHPYVAQTYRMLSDVQRRAGDLDKAEQSLAQAVSIMLNHCDIESKEMSPFILESAKLYAAKGDFEKAQADYRDRAGHD